MHLPGFAALRATYEAEGYYDEAAGGDPEEQELWRIEILDASQAEEATAGDATIGKLSTLGLDDPTLVRLFPAVRWTPETPGPSLVIRYLFVLGHALTEARGPAARQRVLATSAHWTPTVILDLAEALPPVWLAILDEPHGPVDTV